MTTEAQPIEVEKVRDEERFFGGGIVWGGVLLVVSVPVMLFGLAQAPTVGGFVILGVGGVLGGVAFAQVMLRMPYFTRGFATSLLIVLVASIVIAGVALLYSLS